MGVLENLEPKSVFRFFEEMCGIPHGSGNTKQISDWCVSFAKERSLKYIQDSTNDVIIFKDGTAGYENAPALVLQGHLDMVCEKEPDCPIDFTKDGLKLAVDGDFVHAIGTTLGGDDGIAVAMALAILDSKDIPHPPLEVVFTVDEETGMYGATDIDISMLKARRLINIDSEEEGILTVSCAGGATVDCQIPMSRETRKGTLCRIAVTGLMGGHSGIEIDKGRGNSSILMGRMLYRISREIPLHIKSLSGGQKDNAIARQTEALLVAEEKDLFVLKAAVEAYAAILQHEFKTSDPGATAVFEQQGACQENTLDQASSEKAAFLLMNLPNGILAMSADIPGLVETSLNLGVLELRDEILSAKFAIRSSVASSKEYMKERLTCISEYLGGKISIAGDYPAWEFKKDSGLRGLISQVYKEQYGQEPEIAAIHAGLECGIFSGKIEGLDCISIGPNMYGVHTSAEKLSISSVERLWKLLLEVLKRSH